MGERCLGRDSSAATDLYGAGADIVFAAAGSSGLGVFQAAVDRSTPARKLWAIGVDSDQYATVADLPGSIGADAWRQHILTSMLKRYDTAIYQSLDAYAHDRLAFTHEVLGLATGAVAISYSGGYLDDIRPRIEALRRAIIAGSIVVPCEPADRVLLRPALATCVP